MSFKKYIGLIAVIIALLGVANQQNVEVHNQEIVLQYNETNASDVDSQRTISILKRELAQLGVTKFKVIENDGGRLKITYYSNTDVAAVKRVLLKKIRDELHPLNDKGLPFQFPVDGDTVAYNLDVNEIKNGNETDSGLNGIVVLELKPKTDRFSVPKTVASPFYQHSEKETVSSRVAFNLHKNTIHALNNALQQIPEVRAGPCC